MKPGIYHASFRSSVGSFGEGLAVLKGDSVNGGDDGYTYTGVLTEHDGQLTAQLEINQWRAGRQSVFGQVKTFALTLTGAANDASGFTLSGSVTGQPNLRIHISGRFLRDAA